MDSIRVNNGGEGREGDSGSGSGRHRLELLHLPGEILSQIASHLDIQEVIQFLYLHPTLLSLTQTHLSPLPKLIHNLLLPRPLSPPSNGSESQNPVAKSKSKNPYPYQLSILPTLQSLLPPHNPGQLFLEVLIRAEPKWILERLEFGHWGDGIWKKAFESRFLRSWKRYKGDDDSWRAVFLRVLRRLEHRNLGCSHEESWTRFVMIHRNGSASINRIYSETFDPYEIYHEIKHQNNFSSHPTTVRVVLHLQDVRIIALGVLLSQPSLFVNPNAHLILHPPLLRGLSPQSTSSSHQTPTSIVPTTTSTHSTVTGSTTRPIAIRSQSSTSNANEAYFPLVRSLSPSTATSTSYGLSPPSSQVVPHATTPIRTAISNFIPRRRTLSNTNSVPQISVPSQVPASSTTPTLSHTRSNDEGHITSSTGNGTGTGTGTRFGSMLTAVRSREPDENRRRSWAFGRTRSGSITGTHNEGVGMSASLPNGNGFASQGNGNSNGNGNGNGSGHINGGGNALVQVDSRLTDLDTPLPTLDEDPLQSFNSAPEITSGDPETPSYQSQTPYRIMKTPTPIPNYKSYPNYTAPQPPLVLTTSASENPTAGASSKDKDKEPGEKAIVYKEQDWRSYHPEVEDEDEGRVWGGEAVWRVKHPASSSSSSGGERGSGSVSGSDWEKSVEVVRMAEWDESEECRRRWVGPMILIAQLYPNQTLHPITTSVPTEGANIDLGPNGMYASFELEDLQDIAGWVEFRGGGGGGREAFRNGLGFE